MHGTEAEIEVEVDKNNDKFNERVKRRRGSDGHGGIPQEDAVPTTCCPLAASSQPAIP